ncbi:MAG: hypothetical protein JW788_03050, partial [Candidatus Omnitrophica bacterium]|nr:hypothetical protein [Candidatus Omnitrophota bacterium]
FGPDDSQNKGKPKVIYNAFRMLASLGQQALPSTKLNDNFVGAITTKNKDESIAILIYNYIDPDIVKNYLSRNIATLSGAERKFLLRMVKSQGFEKIYAQTLDIPSLRTTNKLKGILKKAQELYAQAEKMKPKARNITVSLKNIKESYSYKRYTIDASCSIGCGFAPIEEKEVSAQESYQESLLLNPYSLNLIVLNKKPKEEEDTALPPQIEVKPEESQQGAAAVANPK